MDKQTKSRLLITWSYAAMAGVALTFVYGFDSALYRPFAEVFPALRGIAIFERWPVSAGMKAASAIFLLMGVGALLRKKVVWGAVAWVASGVFLGSARYYDAVDLSHPRHISHFVADEPNRIVLVRGTIVQDPDQRGRYVNLVIQPEELVPDPDKPEEKLELPAKAGLILARVYPNIGPYYDDVANGDRIELRMPLMPTKDLTNPSGFDYGKYLRARNIYGTSPPWGLRHPDQVKFLGPGNISFLVKISLSLKQKLLDSIRRTMPYPESAFLGGVTLGLRAGLPSKIKIQFQETGVAHVLAVSGLHVGFVHALLLMLCRVFRVHRRMSYFVIVFGLIVFAIITGASPATQRAVLMSSIGQAIYTFGGFGIGGSTRLTIPLVGAILLILSPLWAPDGSFVLSIVAVWSLAHLSEPVNHVMTLLSRGWKLLVLLAFMLVWTGFSAISPEIYQNPPIWIWLGVGLVISLALASYLDRVYPLLGVDIFVLPGWITGLLAAQGAILLGMTYPLSAVYFKMFSVSGVYANFIAIPLVGFIVQLGLLAGLIDIVLSSIGLAWFGTLAALCINASNWYLCQLFLVVTGFFSKHFPYPYIPMPSWNQLIVFYILVLMVVYWKILIKGIAFVMSWANTPVRRWATAGIPLLLVAGFAAKSAFSVGRQPLQLVFFDCGTGNSVLVRTPRGKALLIDGGPMGSGGWGTGETILAPALAKFNIHTIDQMIMTSPRVACSGGLAFVLGKFPVKAVFSSLDLRYFASRMSLRAFLSALGDPFLYLRPHNEESHETFIGMHELLSNEKFRTLHKTVKAGDVLYEESDAGKSLKLKVLWPPVEMIRGTSDDIGNNALVLKLTYGDVSFLLTTQLRRDGEWTVMDTAGPELKSDWLLVPANGSAGASSDEFLKAVDPRAAVMQYGYISWRERRRYHPSPDEATTTAKRYLQKGIELFRTDLTGAVTITTNGKGWNVETILPRTAAGQVEPDPESANEAREVNLF